MHPQQPHSRRATIERALGHLEDGLEQFAIAAELIRELHDPFLDAHVLLALDSRRPDHGRDAAAQLRIARDHPTRDQQSANTAAPPRSDRGVAR